MSSGSVSGTTPCTTHPVAVRTSIAGDSGTERRSPIPQTRTYAMLNMDMIGRLRDNKLELGGAATGDGLEALVTPILTAAGFTASASSVGDDRSDHASFVRGSIPALFFFTGLHDQYHLPTDTADDLNYVGAVKVVDLVCNIAGALARRLHRRDESLKPAVGRHPLEELDALRLAPLAGAADGVDQLRCTQRDQRRLAVAQRGRDRHGFVVEGDDPALADFKAVKG